MNTKTTFCLFLILSVFQLSAQIDEYDPFEGNYTLLKTCEIGLFIDDNASNKVLFLDNNEKDSIYKKQSNPIPISPKAQLKDVAVGDFDGDYLEEAISCYYEETAIDTGIVLYYYNYNPMPDSVSGIQITKILHKYEYGQILLKVGNFDDDIAKELLLSYICNGRIKIEVYNFDNSQANRLNEFIGDTLNAGLGSSARFDLACIDINQDSIDEIACVKSIYLHRQVSAGRYKFTSRFNLEALSINDNQFTVDKTHNFEYVNTFSGDLDNTRSAYIEGLQLTPVDFKKDGTKELAMVFSYKADYQTDGGLFYYEYRRQNFWTAIKPLRVNTDYSIDEGAFKNINDWSYAKRSVNGNNGNYGVDMKGALSMVSADLNDQGGEELIVGNTRYLILVEGDEDLNLVVKYTTANYSLFGINAQKIVDVASLYLDTAAAVIKPHIITYGFASNPYSVLSSHTAPYPQSIAHLKIFEPVLDGNNNILSIRLIQQNELTKADSIDYLNNYLVVLPDFNGGYQLGTPRKIIKNIIQPTIIINAPPTHFDKLNGLLYDVNYMNSNIYTPEFYTQYITSNSSEGVVSTNLNRSWGVSASASGGTNIGIYKVKATVKASYGQDFAQSNTTTESIQVTQESKASTDDKILGLKSEYHIYEYPVVVEGSKMGHMLSSIPVYSAPVWKESKNSELVDFVYTHEPGNIMSYPYYEDVADNPNILGEFNTFVQNTGFSISNSSSESWTLEYSTLSNENIEKSASFGLSLGVTAGGIGWSANVTGDYSQSKMSSHSTTIGQGFFIKTNFDVLDDSFGETGYTLYPYLYWSRCGGLVLDFKVDINPYNSWWSIKYGDKPDPTFILPWKLDPEKNHALSNESKRMLTRDIRIFPSDPKPYDTVTITATLRNFSLMDHDYETQILFYHGDPRNGGRLITDITGESIKAVPYVESRKMSTLTFDWICPEDLYETPWIFAVIDPDNDIEEIHEDNNMGFITLTNDLPEYIPNDIEEVEFNDELEFDVYPNPASSEIGFTFYLTESGLVTIELFNILGQKIETLLYETREAGYQSSYCTINHLPNDVYICHIAVGNKIYSKRLVILK